ncbi:retinaldehyde-binding protein 1-like [Culicoides brevitarsis]|uniref:retinaldehyde-binding protein 1-like n=1 Tax=Culicoides brevitarsis TaxID=469753 RepID=UPI00307C3CE9
MPEAVETKELSADYEKFALEYLGETRKKRETALKEFEKWIDGNKKIVECPRDDSFLLRFLRAKKFDVAAAGELFENYLFYNNFYPQWFKNISTGDEIVAEIIDSGWIVPLPKKDKAGRQIIFYRTKRLDPDRVTSADMTKAQELVCRRLLQDDEVQIGGAIFLSDDADLLQDHITMWTLVDFKKFFDFTSKGAPINLVAIYRMNLPGFARSFYEVVGTVMGPMLKDKMKIITDNAHLHSLIDPSLLPSEYGGELDLKQIEEDFKAGIRAENHKKFDVSPLKIREDLFDKEALMSIRSNFRKLELD